MVLGITQCIPNMKKVKLHNMLCHRATTDDPQIHCYSQSSIKNRKAPSIRIHNRELKFITASAEKISLWTLQFISYNRGNSEQRDEISW